MSRQKVFFATIFILIFLSVVSGVFPSISDVYAIESEPLQILLTNDDGWNAPGIQAMKNSLDSAGYAVTLVAPSTNSSGSGAGLSVSGPVTVVQQSENEYAVDGTPATCVLIGLAIMDPPPDLILSGSNIGFNGGPPNLHSGTIGAALTALSQGIPALAVASDPPTTDMTDPLFAAHFDTVAEFTVRLITVLEEANGSEDLLPPGIGIKIGYPPLPVDEIPGVAFAEQGDYTLFTIGYSEMSPGLFVPQFLPTNPQDADPEGEVAKYLDGYITLLPFDNNITANHYDSQEVRKILKDLTP